MKEFHRSPDREVRFLVVSSLIVFLCAAGLSEADFLDARQASKRPHYLRSAAVATDTLGTVYANPDNLGRHSYFFNLSEKNGIIYTCRAGHIDLAHLRKAADWTAYLTSQTYHHLKKHQTEFTFRLHEPTRYHVRLTYPKNWLNLPDDIRDLIERQIAVGLGQYFAFTATTWHEILTWFGYKSVGIISEFQSAFSWEDMFSNVLGCHLAGVALNDSDHSYDLAMTRALERELKELNVQPRRIAKNAARQVDGLWYTYHLIFLDMIKRNFDTGLDDGFVTPWVVRSVPQCPDACPQSYSAPRAAFLRQYGFVVQLEIEPREWEASDILKVVYPEKKQRKKRLNPDIHLAVIMDYIKEKAVKKYGLDVGRPYSLSAEQKKALVVGDIGLEADWPASISDVVTLANNWLAEQPLYVFEGDT